MRVPTGFFKALAAGALVVSSASAGHRDDYGSGGARYGSGAGPYLDISAGPLWLDEVDGIEFDTGWGLNGEIGWEFGTGWSLGVNGGYFSADAESAKSDGIRFDGDLALIPLMANATYRGTIAGPVSFYIAAGGGVVHGDSEGSLHGKDISFSDSEDAWDAGLQARLGLALDLGTNAKLTFGYRYLRVFGEDDAQGHVAEGGIVIKF